MQCWWYLDGSERKGPLAQADFEVLVASGKVGRDTPVWTAGLSGWVRLADLPRAVQTTEPKHREAAPQPAAEANRARAIAPRHTRRPWRTAAALVLSVMAVAGGGIAVVKSGWIAWPVAAKAAASDAAVWINPLSEKRTVLPAGWHVVASKNAAGVDSYLFKHAHSSIQVLFASDPSAEGIEPADYAARMTHTLFQNVRFDTPRYLGKIGERDVFESLGHQGQGGPDTSTAYFNVIGGGETIWRTVALSGGEPLVTLPGFHALRTALLQSL